MKKTKFAFLSLAMLAVVSLSLSVPSRLVNAQKDGNGGGSSPAGHQPERRRDRVAAGGARGEWAPRRDLRGFGHEIRIGDWWRIAMRELPTGLVLGSILGVIGIVRIEAWQHFHLFDYGVHYHLVALTVGLALVGIVCFGSLAGSMLPFVLKRVGFDPASASAPFVATLVDVTGLVIYFTVALIVLRGTLL